eukprot:TRINITY_DN23422_c1_g2_i1.p1 TRINITY_DN23422_c1_g2~~TRINITY_DN23422_c1_g2_i1.p1  ORF type:complete len:116 (-),score=17.17 TRINITY_DN23422_c1_g2_i1:722-1069(-)
MESIFHQELQLQAMVIDPHYLVWMRVLSIKGFNYPSLTVQLRSLLSPRTFQFSLIETYLLVVIAAQMESPLQNSHQHTLTHFHLHRQHEDSLCVDARMQSVPCFCKGCHGLRSGS